MLAAVGLVLRFGLPFLLGQGFKGANNSPAVASLLPQVVNTLIICGLSVLLAMPAGVLCAVYLLFYGRGSRAAVLIEMLISALTAVPSAVYGLFGFLVFSQLFSLRYSVLAGILTMAVMIFSVAVGTAQAALGAVDGNLPLAALALGATKAEVMTGVLFSAARGGLISAAVLCVAKTAGESAALLLTSGVGRAMPTQGWLRYLASSGATLAVGLYQSVLEGEIAAAFGSAVLLLLFIAACSLLSQVFLHRKGGR